MYSHITNHTIRNHLRQVASIGPSYSDDRFKNTSLLDCQPQGQVKDFRRSTNVQRESVADFKAGKTKAAQAIKGAVMRETKGTANPEVVKRLIVEEMQRAP